MEKPRLLYFADAMCSWCYGFQPEMALLRARFADACDFLLFSGGLRPFNREPMDDKLRTYLSGVYDRIQGITGQPFGAKAKNRAPGFIYDTEPASRAIVTMRHLRPGEEYPFALAIQRAFYAEGEDITGAAVLADHAEAAGVPRAEFLAAFESKEMREATLADFQVAQQLGINGFPALVLHRKNAKGEDELVMVSNGYAKAEEIAPRIAAALKADTPA